MMTASIQTNQRDGTTYAIRVDDDGTPRCPHCDDRMALVDGNRWENCLCGCWWTGADQGEYSLQVVLPVKTPPSNN